MHHPTISTDDLPNECLYKIFNYLNLRDVISCRTVSKRFKSISDLIKFRQLIVCDIIDERKDMWFTDKSRPINYMNAINFQTFRSSFNLKHSLERLHIRKYGDKDFKLPNLAGFNNLQELEIACALSNGHLILELPKLRMLRLIERYNRLKAHLKTPTKLEMLECESVSELKIDHPESIKQLRTYRIDEGELHQLAAMENLEFLQICQADFDSVRLRGHLARILSFLENLKHLQFEIDSGEEAEIRDCLKHVLVKKDALQRPNFKLYLHGVELINGRKIDEYYSSDNIQHFQMKNINLLNGDLSNIKEIYLHPIFTLHNRITTNLISKLYNLRKVIATLSTSDKADVQYLIGLLEKLSNLEELTLFGSKFSQTFFYTLPGICPKLIQLTISGSIGQINFVANFEYLLHLQLYDVAGNFSICRDHPDHKFDSCFIFTSKHSKNKASCDRSDLDLNQLFAHYSRLRTDEMELMKRMKRTKPRS